MVQLREHERFVAKALAGDGRLEEAVAQHLDGKIAVQAGQIKIRFPIGIKARRNFVAYGEHPRPCE